MYNIFTFYMLLKVCIYNIYRASCQSRLSTEDNALSSVAPATTAVKSLERSYAWPPPGLRPLYFLCQASPCPMLRIFAFSWFCMTSALCLHNFVISSYKYGSLKAMCRSRTVCALENFQWLSRAEQSRSLLPAISRHGHSWHRAPVGPVAIYLLDVETFCVFFSFVDPPQW
jgi:hypothetical protein